MGRHTSARQTESSGSPTYGSHKESIASFGKKYSLTELGFVLHNELATGVYSNVFSATYATVRSMGEQTIVKKRDLAVKIIDEEKAVREFSKKFFHRELEILSKVS
ncbi:hypothetical protein GE061_010558 [Apolygus lucorum]|uniref:Uncharacterized protein n=1 Tax=Apolygus lucorum TaxID=248454 RepID=A0A6A4K8I7_APOLU|nr:hypothetical protein GE061_010558 [Apolygus lucorum]